MQANFIERAMIKGFKKMKADGRVDPVNGLGFISVTEDAEMKGTVEYIRKIAN